MDVKNNLETTNTNISPQQQATLEFVARTTIKNSIILLQRVYTNTALENPLKELRKVLERAEAFRDRLLKEEDAGGLAATASSQAPSNAITTDGTRSAGRS